MTQLRMTQSRMTQTDFPTKSPNTGLKRRHFLQSIAALGAGASIPFSLAKVAGAAAPIGSSDGILLLITMSGGCDPLDFVVPIGNQSYYSQRGSLAIPASSTHQISATHGLHPALTSIKQRWDAGHVAVIEGVGDPNGTLSHFDNTDRIMAAQTGEGLHSTGWLGRYMDGLGGGPDPFHGISFGSRVPLNSIGAVHQSTSISTRYSNISDPNTAEPWDQRQIQALQNFGSTQIGQGDLADQLAQASSTAVEMARQVAPLYNPDLPEGDLASQMVMAARLINANLGIRVFSLDFGDFDGHANHRDHLDSGMEELNAGVEAFLAELDYKFLDQVLMLTTTEFGRRVKPNNSGGTDHGAAATYMAIGSQVKGGIYGTSPSLTDLDRYHNLEVQVDFRSVYGTVLNRWLKTDAAPILGASYSDLNFTHGPATVDPGPNPAFAAGLERRDAVIRLYLAYFLRLPDTSGLDFWVNSRLNGHSLNDISSAFAGSPEFRAAYGNLSNREFVTLVYQNVLGRNPDSIGLEFWTSELDSGASRGRIMTGFSDSKENRKKTGAAIENFDQTGPIAKLYRAYFRRAPDRQGRDYWNSTGQSIASISQAFSESPEFKRTYGALSNNEFVSLIYSNVLERPAEASGLSYWTGRLGQGLSRGGLMIHFSEGSEFSALVSP